MTVFKTKCRNYKEFRATYKEYIECNGFEITSDFNKTKSIICLKNPKTETLHVIYY